MKRRNLNKYALGRESFFSHDLNSNKNLTIFLFIAIFVTSYVTNFSGSQFLIELTSINLSDSKFLNNDLLIYSYQNNIHKLFSDYFFYFFYKLENFGFLNSLFLINIILKTFTIYGLYLCYMIIIKNNILALLMSLIHLSPVLFVLPYIGDWYVVGQNLHANSIFYCLFVFIIFNLLNGNYFNSLILQIFALLFHSVLGLFLALPIIIIFLFVDYFSSPRFFLLSKNNLLNAFLIIIFLFINFFIILQLFYLDSEIIDSKTLIDIAKYHAPHHYMISSFAPSKIIYFYFVSFLGLKFFLRYETDIRLIASIKIISVFILIFPFIHFLFTEILYSKIIFSTHILRSASNLSIIFLAPYILIGLYKFLGRR